MVMRYLAKQGNNLQLSYLIDVNRLFAERVNLNVNARSVC